MRVVQFVASRGDGGLEKHVVELSGALASLGVDVTLVADESFRNRVPAKVHFRPIDVSRSRFNPLLYIDLYRIIKLIAPDLLHAQANKASSVVSKLAPFIPTICRVLTIHNLKSTAVRYTGFNRGIGVSNKVTEQILGCSAVTVYNGLSARDTHKVHPRGEVFLAVGRLVPAKGFDLLLRSIQGTSHCIDLVGDGPDFSSLKLLAKELGISDQVNFLGHRIDVLDLMRAAKGVIISSRREGFSYVFAEALLSQTPIVSTEVPVANEFLPEKFLCPVEDVVGLRKLLDNFDANDSDYHTLFEEAKSRLTIDAMALNTKAVYSSVLAEQSLNDSDAHSS